MDAREGLWTARRSRVPRVHQTHERRALVGELVQIDGSAPCGPICWPRAGAFSSAGHIAAMTALAGIARPDPVAVAVRDSIPVGKRKLARTETCLAQLRVRFAVRVRSAAVSLVAVLEARRDGRHACRSDGSSKRRFELAIDVTREDPI